MFMELQSARRTCVGPEDKVCLLTKFLFGQNNDITLAIIRIALLCGKHAGTVKALVILAALRISWQTRNPRN